MKVFKVLSRKVEIKNQNGFQNRSCCGYRKDLVLRKHLMWTSWISALLWCLLEAFLPAEVCWVTEGSGLLLPSLAPTAGSLWVCVCCWEGLCTLDRSLTQVLGTQATSKLGSGREFLWVRLARLCLIPWNADGCSSVSACESGGPGSEFPPVVGPLWQLYTTDQN